MDIIFDVDGTLLNIEHRLHFIQSTVGVPKNWNAFRKAAVDDTINEDIMQIADALRYAGHRLIIATGRAESERQVTMSKLAPWLGSNEPLYMRKDKDFRKDYLVKEEMLAQMRLDGFNPTLAFDDRQRVVDMWRANGIRCCQVAKGDF